MGKSMTSAVSSTLPQFHPTDPCLRRRTYTAAIYPPATRDDSRSSTQTKPSLTSSFFPPPLYGRSLTVHQDTHYLLAYSILHPTWYDTSQLSDPGGELTFLNGAWRPLQAGRHGRGVWRNMPCSLRARRLSSSNSSRQVRRRWRRLVASVPSIPNRNRPQPQPLLVLGRPRLRRNRPPLLQWRSKRRLTLARGAVHCAAQSITQLDEPNSRVAHCWPPCSLSNSAELSGARSVFLVGLPMRMHLLAL